MSNSKRNFAFLWMLLMMAASLAFCQEKPTFTADKHRANGMVCAGCHGEGPKKAVPGEKCLSCHESMESIAKRTVYLSPNPHASHLMDLECTLCHHGHKANELYCKNCHDSMEIKRVSGKPQSPEQ